MKIEKTVDVSVDVTVDVDLDDIVSSIWEAPNSLSTVLRGISNCHRFLKAIPDDLLAQFNEKQRETVYNAMTEQAQRYRPTVGAPHE